MEIKLSNVTCGYNRVDVLKDVNLVFKTGHIYSVLGSNGIGKTTLFKTILGFIPPKDGTITINGIGVENIDAKELAEYISYVPQAKNYSYQYSVVDTVLMGRARFIKKYEMPSIEDYQMVDKMLAKLGIEKLKNCMYSELSGGEQQIVLIARALVQDSYFIVMDEPASNLDFENQKRVIDTLKYLSGREIGVIMSSHSPDHALYSDSDIVMITKNKEIIAGDNSVLTSETLSKVYGMDVRIISEKSNDGIVHRSCCFV